MSSTVWMIVLFLLLFLCSAFFSGSETAMMALNRYRLRHRIRKGSHVAKKLLDLLARPDRLLGVVLIGNTFCNVLVSSLVTVMVLHIWGEAGVLPATIVLTVALLVFAETAPKTVAALYPGWFAGRVVHVLQILLRILYPLVWLVNGAANLFLRLFGVRVGDKKEEKLSNDELASLVRDASGQLSGQHREMLLSILGLEAVEVKDVLVPRHEVLGIDLSLTWPSIVEALKTLNFAYIPVYKEHIDQLEGVLNVKALMLGTMGAPLSKESLIQHIEPPYFIPEGAELSQQLIYFQQKNQQIGFVVDEYGEILGLITLQDILEEIVGQFSESVAMLEKKLVKQLDGSYLVDAGIGLRDLNRLLSWSLPVDGPNTLSGLIIETLQTIPTGPQSLTLAGQRIQIIAVDGTTIDQVRIWPPESLDESSVCVD